MTDNDRALMTGFLPGAVIKVFRFFFEISKHSSVKIAYTKKGGLWG